MNVAGLEKIIGYEYKNKAIAARALTHASADVGEDYERLEFLGDAVLQLGVTNRLFFKHREAHEGSLSKMRAELVCETALAHWANSVNLGELIRMGRGEEMSGGREKSSILSDIVEAVIASVYIDGGYDEADKLIGVIFEHGLKAKASGAFVDCKTRLQEYLQKNGNVDIDYKLIKTEGPPHDARFFVSVSLDGRELARGEGRSKKSAEQEAAANALTKLAVR